MVRRLGTAQLFFRRWATLLSGTRRRSRLSQGLSLVVSCRLVFDDLAVAHLEAAGAGYTDSGVVVISSLDRLVARRLARPQATADVGNGHRRSG
jgi:hypothetical protein